VKEVLLPDRPEIGAALEPGEQVVDLEVWVDDGSGATATSR
jgi:hypothetical protein